MRWGSTGRFSCGTASGCLARCAATSASYSYSMSVSQMLAGKLPITALLTALAFLLIVVISIPLGIFTAGHAGGRFDKALTVANQVLMAVPPFFTGVLLTLIFGLTLRWFTPGRSSRRR